MLRNKIPRSEKRSFDRLLHHYNVEKALAQKLRESTREDRAVLYNSLYDQLFKAVPDHPLLSKKEASIARQASVKKSLKLIKRHITQDSTFLEIGAGDCALSIAAAKCAKKVYAIDVSKELTKRKNLPTNLEVIISDGISLPLNSDSVNIAYSNQLMEHLHPEDALEQMKNVYKVLKQGGLYYCITPNRITGPHDISRYFDEIATCFHQKEYTNTELSEMLRRVGFVKISARVGKNGIYMMFPMKAKIALEKICYHLPQKIARFIIMSIPVRLILRIVIEGKK